MNKKGSKRIYLDNAAATPLDKSVKKIMDNFCVENFENPSALYKEGVAVKNIIEKARSDIAKVLSSHSNEIIFTGSGTESNNLAILGLLGGSTPKLKNQPHIITTKIEHPSVLNVCKYLEKEKLARVDYVGVDSEGLVDIRKIKKLLNKNTVLVSVIYANNEIGTIQPIKEIAKTIRYFKKNILGRRMSKWPVFHTDACQATNYLNINVIKLGVDMMTFNGSKIYGPKGVGVLYKKRNLELEPIIYGGGQEGGLRSGTENVSAIVGMAEALKISEKMKEKESARLVKLRDYFIKNLNKQMMDIGCSSLKLNGSWEKGFQNRLPNNINFSFPNIESQLMVLRLDAYGVAVSAKSACASDDDESSYVVDALGNDIWRGKNSVRFSMGRDTTKSDIDKTIKAILEIWSKYAVV